MPSRSSSTRWLALRAPTGANGQNWEFIVVKDRRVIKKLAGRYRRFNQMFEPTREAAMQAFAKAWESEG